MYNFLSLDDFISSFEVDLVNLLDEYQLLSKFSLDAKKVILYVIVNKLNEKLHDKNLLIYHSHTLSPYHELLKYYPSDKFNNYINKLCAKIKKVTGRLFFIKSSKKIKNVQHLNELDGSIMDEIILMDNTEVEAKNLKKFLHEHNLKELFDSLRVKINQGE